MSLKIKESELKDILDEVASDLAKAFESEKDALKKAELAKDDVPGEETPGEDAGGGPPAEGSESAPPVDASASAPPDAGPPAGPDASASPDAAPSPEGVDPAAEQAAALTPEALQAEYSKLAPEELDMHIKAALQAKAAVAGAPGGLPPDASAPPLGADAGVPPMGAGPAGPPPGAPPAGPDPLAGPPAMKNELTPSPERKGKNSIDALGKSADLVISMKKYEDEIDSLKALAKSQQEDVENLTKILTKVLEQPLRKAVTTVAHLPKADEKKELNAGAIHSRLRELSAKPDLKKSDRQLINDFYDGRVKADKLAPLFEDYK